jgi:hypothetical protein
MSPYNMDVRLANLSLGTELPKQLKLLYDGGPKKWCETFSCSPVCWWVLTCLRRSTCNAYPPITRTTVLECSLNALKRSSNVILTFNFGVVRFRLAHEQRRRLAVD